MNDLDVLAQAKAQRLLPSDAQWPARDEGRPWPVLLLTAIGAWFVAVPLLIVIVMLTGDWLRQSLALLMVGAALVLLATLLLRQRQLPLFIEQLAPPLLLTGLLALGWWLVERFNREQGLALLGLLLLVLAWPLQRTWLRALLGAAAAGSLALAMGESWGRGWRERLSGSGISAILVLVWAAAAWLNLPLRLRQAWDALGQGWLLAALALAAWSSGQGWLLRGLVAMPEHDGGTAWPIALALGSCLLVLLGYALLAQRWPLLRRPRALLSGAVLAALALLMPQLGPVLLAAALCLREGRWRLAATAALAALWVLGSFYGSLAWPLAHKGLALMAAGALLGLISMGGAGAGGAEPTARHRLAWLSGLSLLGTLLVVNGGIWRNERLIAEGEVLFVELAPADPRSLMQGDFMRLNYAFTAPSMAPDLTPPVLVFRRDERHIGRFVRLHGGEPLGAQELRVRLSAKNGSWVLVSDAWFFREGDAARWQAARYGEFRIRPNGTALLVNLRGPDLRPL